MRDNSLSTSARKRRGMVWERVGLQPRSAPIDAHHESALYSHTDRQIAVRSYQALLRRYSVISALQGSVRGLVG